MCVWVVTFSYIGRKTGVCEEIQSCRMCSVHGCLGSQVSSGPGRLVRAVVSGQSNGKHLHTGKTCQEKAKFTSQLLSFSEYRRLRGN